MLSSVLRASIIVIVYNGEQYIERAVQSALGQTVADIEVIVVDDGSSDGSADRVGRIKDSRLRLVRQSNQGPSAARNTGIREAKSDWIAFLDCDDWWTPDKLEHQLATAARGTNVALVYSGATTLLEDGSVLSEAIPRLRGAVLKELLLGNHITGSSSSVLIRRDVLSELGGFRTDIHYGEDWDLWLRIAARHRIEMVPGSHVYLLSRRESQGMQVTRMRDSCLRLLGEAFDTYASHLTDLRRHATIAVHYRAAIDYELVGQLPAARAELRKVLSLAPLHTSALRRMARLCWTMVRDARGASASEQA
jgi:glycosyltransferase involved in cell wall biosynthesis